MGIRVPATAGKVTHIGRAGENLATTVEFDVRLWIQEFGTEGTFQLFVQQGGNYFYPQTIDNNSLLSEGKILWHIADYNTSTIGLGKCQLLYKKNETILKSIIYDIAVTNSLDSEGNEGDIPAPIESWMNDVTERVEEIEGLAFTIEDRLDEAQYYSQQAERWAKGTQDGVPVSSGNGYHDNSKYYAERVQSLTIGTVTTGAAGSNAAASIDLNQANNTLNLNLTIPRGNPGTGGASVKLVTWTA